MNLFWYEDDVHRIQAVADNGEWQSFEMEKETILGSNTQVQNWSCHLPGRNTTHTMNYSL